MGEAANQFEHLRLLPDGSLTAAEVGILLDRIRDLTSSRNHWMSQRSNVISLDLAALSAERDRLRAALAEIHNLVVDLDTTAIGLSIESIARHALRAALDPQEASRSVRAEPDEPNRTTGASE